MGEALEQCEVAERVGLDYVWGVEHHFLEEYSHSSAPEVFLGAVSQRTTRLRIGHGVIQLPPVVNHPARVAERVATLDLVSNGRVEFGVGEGSSAAELGGFGVERARKREMSSDALAAITHMFVEEPFAGWSSPHLRMPPRNVVPKPAQRPHPPLWLACSRRDSIRRAARLGMGALCFGFIDPEDAATWVDEYYALVASDECVPAGFAVNPNIAVVVPLMCAADETTAIQRGIDGAHFFTFGLAHYAGLASHRPARTDVHAEFQRQRRSTGFARELLGSGDGHLEKRLARETLGAVRGAIGTPAQIVELLRRYEEAGVDQVIFIAQSGTTAHEHVCESLELLGREVVPQFVSERDDRERAKSARLAEPLAVALARRTPPRPAPHNYRIDERQELERGRLPFGERVRSARARATGAIRERNRRALVRLVCGASDEELGRYFGLPAVQRVVFSSLCRTLRGPEGFEARIVYELVHADARPPDRWTLHVSHGRCRAVRGGETADLRMRLAVADFARAVAGELSFPAAALEGRLDLDGDRRIVGRLSEMLSSPRAREEPPRAWVAGRR